MNEMEKLKDAISGVVQYNGLDEDLKEMRDIMLKVKEKDNDRYIGIDDLGLGEPLVFLPRNRQEVYFLGQLHFIYMMLVQMFGDYGTSPRFGWIDDKEGAAAFLDDLIKSSITYLD